MLFLYVIARQAGLLFVLLFILLRDELIVKKHLNVSFVLSLAAISRFLSFYVLTSWTAQT